MRPLPLAAIFSLLLFLLPHPAGAQTMFYSFGTTNGFGNNFGGAPTMVWRHQVSHTPGAYDPRMDVSMVLAARFAEQHAEHHSLLRCWKYVKTALLQAGAVRSYPTTAYAKQAGDELTSKHGFVQLHVRDPYCAPVGSVIVYGGSGAGHVELRTERGFVSDYRSTNACRFPLIGIYAKLSSDPIRASGKNLAMR